MKPNAPFSKLGVSGDATFEGAISFHGIKLTYDSTNKAIKIDGNLYATGGITAYGAGASATGGGGGLNGSVKSYSNALKLTSESLSEIASAYSIKALDSRISSLEGGSAMNVSVSGSGNAVTAISKSGTTISVTKGTTFLTSHQSLASYLTRTDAASLYQPKGNYLTSHQSLANYYTKSETDSKLNGYLPLSGGTMQANARITHGDGNLYIGNTNNSNWVAVQDICSQSSIGDGIWSIRVDGTAHFQSIKFPSNRLIAQVSNGSNSPLKGIKLPYLQSDAIGLFSRVGNASDEGGIILSEDTCVIYNSFDTGWGLSVRDKDLNQTDVSSDDTVAFGIRDTYKLYSRGGFEKKDSSDDYVLLGGGGHSKITDLSVANADTVDGVHVTWAGEIVNTSCLAAWENDGSALRAINPANVSVGNADKLDGYHANGSNVAPYGHIPTIESNGVMEVGKYIDFHNDNSGKHDFSTRLQTTGNYGNSVNLPSNNGTLALTSDNVASATKLQTPRTIWGQSFDGTGNVDGTIYINNSNSSNGAIRLNSDISSNARISAIDDQVIFNTGNAIRFGGTAWDWNQWAGLRYNHSDKTIYLGIANGSIFNANSPQSDGTLRLAGIKTVTPDNGARIGGSGSLYIGNANNSGWVYVQDMCSQVNSSYWNITQYGSAIFKSLTVSDVISCNSISVSKNAVIAGNLSVNGLIDNKGILPTNYEVNNKGTNCYVSADALCSGITAITDSIQVNQVTVQYSNDNGNSWTNYPMGNDAKFNLYASKAGLTQVYLGYNVITGNNDAEKLAQIKKNELMFSFEIPNSCYSQVYFACVDIGKGVGVTCTVEYLNSKGVIVNTYIKYMTGWNQFNYINLSNGNAAYGVGNDDRRYIRFRFKHDQNTTALRNASIYKIRIFAFTKYSFPTDRFMGHTGHIYNFDYNMNTYFPNSILAKGGVTAYQSSDIRLKQDLRKLDYLGIIKAMGGTYGFAWKKDNTRSIGWIAQHVLCNPHLKDIVETDEKGYYKINYWSPKLIATAFGAIEQVGDEVSRLKARVVFLESEVQRLSGKQDGSDKKRLDNKNINSLN